MVDIMGTGGRRQGGREACAQVGYHMLTMGASPQIKEPNLVPEA